MFDVGPGRKGSTVESKYYFMLGGAASLVALITYSIGAIGVSRSKGASRTAVIFLWVGFVADVVTTGLMALGNSGFDFSPGIGITHTIIGFIVMAGMLAAAIAATLALPKAREGATPAIARWVLVPWVAWVLMFIWAAASRGGTRS